MWQDSVLFSPLGNRAIFSTFCQESPRQTKPKKGPRRKVHEFRPFLWILVFFLRKTSTIHIELLFRNAPAKSSWTDLSLVWFAGATPDFEAISLLNYTENPERRGKTPGEKSKNPVETAPDFCSLSCSSASWFLEPSRKQSRGPF